MQKHDQFSSKVWSRQLEFVLRFTRETREASRHSSVVSIVTWSSQTSMTFNSTWLFSTKIEFNGIFQQNLNLSTDFRRVLKVATKLWEELKKMKQNFKKMKQNLWKIVKIFDYFIRKLKFKFVNQHFESATICSIKLSSKSHQAQTKWICLKTYLQSHEQLTTLLSCYFASSHLFITTWWFFILINRCNATLQ